MHASFAPSGQMFYNCLCSFAGVGKCFNYTEVQTSRSAYLLHATQMNMGKSSVNDQ